jgi:hypothetical protein
VDAQQVVLAVLVVAALMVKELRHALLIQVLTELEHIALRQVVV